MGRSHIALFAIDLRSKSGHASRSAIGGEARLSSSSMCSIYLSPSPSPSFRDKGNRFGEGGTERPSPLYLHSPCERIAKEKEGECLWECVVRGGFDYESHRSVFCTARETHYHARKVFSPVPSSKEEERGDGIPVFPKRLMKLARD